MSYVQADKWTNRIVFIGSFESYLRRFYEPPRLELLRDMIKIMFAPEGHGSVRVFYLSEGCFDENFSEAYFLYVGKNAAFYRRVSYDLWYSIISSW